LLLPLLFGFSATGDWNYEVPPGRQRARTAAGVRREWMDLAFVLRTKL
jgi:hypothetical protein